MKSVIASVAFLSFATTLFAAPTPAPTAASEINARQLGGLGGLGGIGGIGGISGLGGLGGLIAGGGLGAGLGGGLGGGYGL